MKLFILLFVVSSPLMAFECRLSGKLSSEKKMETTLFVSSFEECKMFGAKTTEDNFFGLVSKEDKLIETKVMFKSEEGSKSEVIQSEPSEDII